MKWKIFHEPYPFDPSLKKSFFSSLLFGAFIFLFLILFQPFGLRNYEHEYKVFHLLGYGLVTSACLFSSNLFFSLFLKDWFSKAKWTVGKNVIYTLWVFFLIGLGNLLYSSFLSFIDLSLNGFIQYQVITVLVGIFPVIISTFFKYNQRLKRALREAAELNANVQHANPDENILDLPSKNKSESLRLKLSDLLAIKAEENYVEVITSRGNEVQKSMLRNTLRDMENYFSAYPFVKKCHRSYLVNLQKVNNFSGNAQGLNLMFDAETAIQIPVSRSFVSDIKKQLKAKNE